MKLLLLLAGMSLGTYEDFSVGTYEAAKVVARSEVQATVAKDRVIVVEPRVRSSILRLPSYYSTCYT